MTIEKARMTFEQAKEAYYSAIRSNIMNTLTKSLSDDGLKIDIPSMTYKHDDILTQEEQETASKAELAAHDKAFDKVKEILDKAADAVYAMLRQTDIDEWCRVEALQYCDNMLGLDIVFDRMEYFLTIYHEN